MSTPTERVKEAIFESGGNDAEMVNGDDVVMADFALALASELEQAQEEIATLENLRSFDTGSKTLPPGLVLEHSRLDLSWRELVRERDEAKRALRQSESGAAALRDLLQAVTTHEFDEATFNDVIVDGKKMNWFDARDKALKAANEALEGTK